MVPIVKSAVRVLEAVARGEGDSAAEISRRVGMAGSSCYRVLKTFEEAGWVICAAGGGYGLGNGLLPVLRALGTRERMLARWLPEVRRAARETGLTGVVWFREGDDAVVAGCALPERAAAVAWREGSRVSLVRSGVGACLLVGMGEKELGAVLKRAGAGKEVRRETAERVREAGRKGWVVDAGAMHEQLVSVVSPVVAGGRVLGAVGFTGLPREFSVRAAGRLGRMLGRVVKRCEE